MEGRPESESNLEPRLSRPGRSLQEGKAFLPPRGSTHASIARELFETPCRGGRALGGRVEGHEDHPQPLVTAALTVSGPFRPYPQLARMAGMGGGGERSGEGEPHPHGWLAKLSTGARRRTRAPEVLAVGARRARGLGRIPSTRRLERPP